ncbi:MULTISPECIES: hypothetical protein [Mesorhizobium]|uniref:hypothetical protein n=1 Tax=Mesorhizobium TaxID=68287 RepID=UPI001FCEA8B8|nr:MULTISPECIES: hypothetical protein [Mesorhizobium]
MLRDFGVSISKRQVVRILTSKIDAFVAEARQVLTAGLASASVDNTGARHGAVNGVCTQFGNDRFAVFTATKSKSRLNFLRLLNGGAARWVLNAASRAYMLERRLPVVTTDLLHARREPSGFEDEASWDTHLLALAWSPRMGVAGFGGAAAPDGLALDCSPGTGRNRP